jgi:hypothetical protein
MAAIAASVAAPAIVHNRAEPVPVVALPAASDPDKFRRLINQAASDSHQPIRAEVLCAAAEDKSRNAEGYRQWPVAAGLLHFAVEMLAAELNRLRGHGACIPGPASQFLRAPLGGSEAMIEYSADDEGDLCVERALINGRWIEADQFAPDVLEQWHEAIRADIEQQRRDDAETHAVRRYEAARGL